MATEGYDIWAITIVFAVLEGYSWIYYKYFFNPI